LFDIIWEVKDPGARKFKHYDIRYLSLLPVREEARKEAGMKTSFFCVSERKKKVEATDRRCAWAGLFEFP
jgi:hypothetical protein